MVVIIEIRYLKCSIKRGTLILSSLKFTILQCNSNLFLAIAVQTITREIVFGKLCTYCAVRYHLLSWQTINYKAFAIYFNNIVSSIECLDTCMFIYIV